MQYWREREAKEVLEPLFNILSDVRRYDFEKGDGEGLGTASPL